MHNIEGQVKFVLYTDQGGMWRVQAVTVKGTAFTNRVGLLESWRGVRDAELEKVRESERHAVKPQQIPSPFPAHSFIPSPSPSISHSIPYLCQVSGIPGCKFVHNSGFIGGNKEFEGALLMAQKSIAGA